MIWLTRRHCNKKIRQIRRELVGGFLILLVIPYIILFGINAASIVYSLLFLSVGLCWLLSKPSQNTICKDCLRMEKDDRVERWSTRQRNGVLHRYF